MMVSGHVDRIAARTLGRPGGLTNISGTNGAGITGDRDTPMRI
jgi:hypothetical protein